ncbi:hypothetical protein [Kitasatospora sp. NPDC091207]|uniref:hypothetical protein n=1 Tax=Kitasatospora sp. NPDC091207 TaxID=3364083 RepID=UPI003828C185
MQEIPGEGVAVADRVFHPGIGALLLVPGPDGLRVWTPEHPPAGSRYGAPVEANILLEHGDDLDQVDLALVAEVLGRVDHYLTLGLGFVRGALEDDPGFFGLTAAELGRYRGPGPADVPLEEPQLNFYVDAWHLRFAEGRLPICDPYGLAVVFDGHRPVRIEDLSEAADVDAES